jgi:hypothetical protein
MRIPEVRTDLSVIAAELRTWTLDPEIAADRIDVLVGELYRRPYARRARAKSKTITASMKQEIYALAIANPDDLLYREIGLKFGVDGGRVSEIVAGFRS